MSSEMMKIWRICQCLMPSLPRLFCCVSNVYHPTDYSSFGNPLHVALHLCQSSLLCSYFACVVQTMPCFGRGTCLAVWQRTDRLSLSVYLLDKKTKGIKSKRWKSRTMKWCKRQMEKSKGESHFECCNHGEWLKEVNCVTTWQVKTKYE